MLGEPVCDALCSLTDRDSASVDHLSYLARNTLQPVNHAAWFHFSHAQTSKKFRPASQRVSFAPLSSYPSLTSSVSN